MLRRTLTCGLVAAALLAVPAGAATAAPIIVNSTGDWTLQDSDLQACTSGTDTCILRAAVYAANQANGGATIQFASSVTGTIALTQGSLPVSSSMTIVGPGANALAIDGADNTGDGIIEDAAASLAISGLTLQNGTSSDGLLSTAGGGAIEQTAGVLDVSSMAFTNNTGGAGNDGGAIYAGGAATTVANSSFTGNSASSGPLNGGGSGGAIGLDDGTLSVAGSTFTSSSADAVGGAIYADGGAASISGSTFTANTGAQGGAIRADEGPLSVASSTFSANWGQIEGAAIDDQSGDVVTISGSHITGNRTWDNGVITAAGTVDISNTLIENNAGIDWAGVTAPQAYLLNVTITGNFITNSDGVCVPSAGVVGCTAGIITGGGAVTGSTITGNTVPPGAGPDNCVFYGPVADGGGNTLAPDCQLSG
jgi:predicted outer membrane repeat protein